MHEATLEKRVDRLEEAMMELIYQARKTEMKVEKLAEEMLAFKDEMRAFKDEINKKWGELANTLGRLAEDIVAPGI
ncbi:MAG: hypothetical protein ACP5TY_00590, partial [Thermodesulforhabdaceae bacterium]